MFGLAQSPFILLFLLIFLLYSSSFFQFKNNSQTNINKMENSKQPIYPCIMQQVGDNDYRLHRDSDAREHRIPMMGLTKREHFASIAMQGLLAGHAIDEKFSSGVDTVAKFAIEYADELLKQLAEGKTS
jgi:hypothetical protein